jgi:hypothetical protein
MTYKYLISTNIIFYTTKKSFTVHRKIFSVCPVRFRFLQAKRLSFGKNRYKGNSAEALLVKTCRARYDC